MQTPNHQDFMHAALAQAKIAKEQGAWPFGAVVVCDNKIVGEGKCEDGTTGDVTDHAKMIALRKACIALNRNRLNDCTIYTTNEPCPMCAAAIFQAKIPHVVIGLSREDVSHLLRLRKIRIQHLAEDSGYEVKIDVGLLREEILEAFQDISR